MAYENNLQTIPLPAAADLSSSQYLGIVVNSSGQAAVAAEGQRAIGILQDNPAASGRAACVGVGGVSKVVAGGTVTAGARFTFDSAGKAVALGSGDDWSLGVALEDLSSGKIGTVLIQPTGAHGLGSSNTP